jgi:hypothetical protein
LPSKCVLQSSKPTPVKGNDPDLHASGAVVLAKPSFRAHPSLEKRVLFLDLHLTEELLQEAVKAVKRNR